MTTLPQFDFFYDAGSCSLAVRIVLEELHIPYVEHRVTARASNDEASRPAWLARNPKGRVPALSPVAGRAGGEELLLTEVPAIMTFLARLRPELDLVPGDPAREARTIEWMNWLSGSLHAVAFGAMWRPERFATEPAAQADLAGRGRDKVEAAFAAIEAVLADGRSWAVPDAYSIADPFLLVFYRWGSDLGIDMATYPAWTSLSQRMLERPAVRSAFAKDELPTSIP